MGLSGAAGALTPPGAGPEYFAGAKAPPGAGPGSSSGAKAPPGAGPQKMCRGEAPPGAGLKKSAGACRPRGAYPGPRKTLVLTEPGSVFNFFFVILTSAGSGENKGAEVGVKTR